MGFTIIVAVDNQRGIGVKNNLPWKLRADMKWFKETTLSKDPSNPNVVIMGRKTWDSIPDKFRPLPARINIVITRSPNQCRAEHCAKTFAEALDLAYQKGQEVFVIGGSSIYDLAFNHPDLEKLYITEINKDFHCDTFFPDYSHLVMQEILRQGQEEDMHYKIKSFLPKKQ